MALRALASPGDADSIVPVDFRTFASYYCLIALPHATALHATYVRREVRRLGIVASLLAERVGNTPRGDH